MSGDPAAASRLTPLRAALVILSAAVLGFAVLVLGVLPPAALPAVADPVPLRFPSVVGAYHVHSRRSDGTGTLDEIAAAAADAGLQFVVVTDHGDGRRPPEPPAYRAGVLVIDGVEINTADGHCIALGLPASPFKLAGTSAAVLEDVHRLGGIGLAAHPDSAHAALQWHAWDAAIDGLEWLNADSEWRDELWAALGRGLLTYTFRPAETLAAFLNRPDVTLKRWDDLGKRQKVVGMAGADAHARLGWRRSVDPYEDRVIARVPGYKWSFSAFQTHLVLDRPFGGVPQEDAATVLRAIQQGRIYTTVDGLGRGGAFEFHAESAGGRAEMGSSVDAETAIDLVASASMPAGTRLLVLRDGEAVYDTTESMLRLDISGQPGVYRIEAVLPTTAPRANAVPWLVSNPIYVGLADAHRAAADRTRRAPTIARLPVDTAGWSGETSAGSVSTVELGRPGDGRPAVAWRFALGQGSAPYAAMRLPVDLDQEPIDRLLITMRSDRPGRLWVQFRAPDTGERWGATFYADAETREVIIPFDQLQPVGPTATAAPVLSRIDSLLFVADTLNHDAGDGGELHIRELWLGR